MAALLSVGLVVAVLSYSLPARAAPFEPPIPVDNPDLDASCGLDVLVILDESGSIASSGATDDVREAFEAFVGALNNTGSRVAVVEFSKQARLAVDSYVTVTNQTIADTFLPYINNGYDPDGNTNWEDALRAARYFLPRPSQDQPHLVLFITDGDPTEAVRWDETTYDPGNPIAAANEYENKIPLDDDEVQSADSDLGDTRAIPNANGIKFQGSHILTVGIGEALDNANSQQRLEDVSGPDVFDGSGQLDISTDDLALVPDFDQLADALREAAFGLCAPSVTVQKLADDDPEPGTDELFPVSGYDITAQVTAPGGISDWILPPDGTGDTVTVATDGAGFSTFQWEPGAEGDATIVITEEDPGTFGFEFDPDSSECSFRTADEPTDQPVPDFTPQALGYAFTVPFESIVTCTLVNRLPAEPSIDVEKHTDGVDADTPADAPFIPVGETVLWEYEVTNTGNVTLSEVAVTDDQTGSVGTCPQSTLAPGESMVCEVEGTAADTQAMTDGVYANVGAVSAEAPDGASVTDEDPSHYESAESDIRVVKSVVSSSQLGEVLLDQTFDANTLATAPTVLEGEQITYTFEVSNVGTEALINVAVTDPIAGPVDCPQTTLAPDETITCTAPQVAAGAGRNVNLALATGEGEISAAPHLDTDPAQYLGAAPAIDVEKLTNLVDADTPAEAPEIPAGNRLAWIYRVTNTGNVDLDSFNLTDDQQGAPTCLHTSLPVGARAFCIISGTAESTVDLPGGVYANNATADSSAVVHTVIEGADLTEAVSDADPSHYVGVAPGIDIEKSTNGFDADMPTGPFLTPGDPITWEYVVTNTGNKTFDNVAVVDPVLREVVCTQTNFEPGAQFTCQASGTAEIGQYVNGGIAVGVTLNPSLLAAGDLSHYLGASGTINLEKHTNGFDADTVEDSPYIDIGDEVTWSYIVRNEGNSTMTQVTVVDDQLGDITCPADTLAVEEEMTCTATGTSEEGIYENEAAVTAVDAAGASHEDSDPSHYRGVEPGIDIQKLTNGVDADNPPGVQVGMEDQVVWTYQVTTGGHPTADITVVDDDLGVEPTFVGGDNNDNGILELGEVWVYEATGTADQAQYSNVATVDGYDMIDETDVANSDPSNYQTVISVTGGDFSVVPFGIFLAVVGLGILLGIRLRHRES